MLSRLWLCLLCLAGTIASAPLLAQDYPNRTIRMIVPFPPGGLVDLNGRAVATQMESRLGVSVVVENRAGAGGLVGSLARASASPDGYTLGSVVPSTVSAAFQKVPMNVFTAFTPIGSVYIGPLAISTNAQTGAKTLKEFIDYAKANPGKLNFGTSSGPPGLAMGVLGNLAGFKMEVIQYKGAAPAMTALIANEVQANFGAISQFAPLMASGRVVPLAVAGDKRMPAIPNVPTMTEAGYPGVKAYTINAIMGPAGVPPALVAKLAPAIRAAIAAPDVVKLFSTNGSALDVSNEELMRMVREEIEFWQKAGELTGFKPD